MMNQQAISQAIEAINTINPFAAVAVAVTVALILITICVLIVDTNKTTAHNVTYILGVAVVVAAFSTFGFAAITKAVIVAVAVAIISSVFICDAA